MTHTYMLFTHPRINYKGSNNAQRSLTFTKNESATSQPDLKKTRSTLTIGIATGLPKDTGWCLLSWKKKK